MCSSQLRVLHLGLLQDGDVGVGVFPERESFRPALHTHGEPPSSRVPLCGASTRELSRLVVLLERRRQSAVVRHYSFVDIPATAPLDQLVMLSTLFDDLRQGTMRF